MRKAGWKSWETALPENSDAFRDLEDFCAEMGDIDRAIATRFILIAWSKARRGQLGQMWGFSFAGAGQVPSPAPAPVEPVQESKKKELRGRQTVTKAAVDALDLD